MPWKRSLAVSAMAILEDADDLKPRWFAESVPVEMHPEMTHDGPTRGVVSFSCRNDSRCVQALEGKVDQG